ncbi:DUF523 domain-containing protein [Candidatus Dependentiae bacterium]
MEKNKEKVLCSACLTGTKCRYNGTDAFNKKTLVMLSKSEIISVCPELLAGEPIPRPACSIHHGDGHDVIKGKAKIIGEDGKDYTESYLKGAQKALKIALEYNVKKAYLKSKSPTCGCGKIFDAKGQNLKIGNGIFAALLLDQGIEVISLD